MSSASTPCQQARQRTAHGTHAVGATAAPNAPPVPAQNRAAQRETKATTGCPGNPLNTMHLFFLIHPSARAHMPPATGTHIPAPKILQTTPFHHAPPCCACSHPNHNPHYPSTLRAPTCKPVGFHPPPHPIALPATPGSAQPLLPGCTHTPRLLRLPAPLQPASLQIISQAHSLSCLRHRPPPPGAGACTTAWAGAQAGAQRAAST